MASDDEMFVIIVDDDYDDLESRSENTKFLMNFEVKEEPLDEDTEKKVDTDILQMALRYGQVEYILPDNSNTNRINEVQIKLELIENCNENAVKQEDLHPEESYNTGEQEDDADPDQGGGTHSDEEYSPEVEYVESDDVISDDNIRTFEGFNKKESIVRVLKPEQWISFVDVLRHKNPELKQDSTKLVNALVEVMKGIKRPPPPSNYYVMKKDLYECVFCGARTKTNPAAWLHYQEKHGKRYLTCFACGMTFRSTTNLYKHEKLCPAPDATVVLKARALTLGRKGRSRPFMPKYDKKAQQNKTRYPCELCSAVFNSKYNLRSHEYLHRGERPYRCHACPAAYTSVSALRRHEAKHSNIKFICDHCKREFVSKTNLVTHMDTHLPEPRFACDACPRRYATRAALQLHQRREHLRLPPPCACQLCPRRYPRMSVLKNHMRKVHGMVLMTRRMFFKQLPSLPDSQLVQPNAPTTKINLIEPVDKDEEILDEQTGLIQRRNLNDVMTSLTCPVSYIFTKIKDGMQNEDDRERRKNRKKNNKAS
ncbi:zinc finger protein 836-like [Galleria mellonella]|uniref:Zinc finger protein 836-like n=1 Tax=Galleria mellonella TaxID=7137 RepID=A0ABM3N2B3_GALME|nr:zinc finger protein 836-like [Galleria mellonella]